MKPKFKPLTLEDFGLSKDELKNVVTGSQRFLAPVEDEETVDVSPETETSLEHANQS